MAPQALLWLRPWSWGRLASVQVNSTLVVVVVVGNGNWVSKFGHNEHVKIRVQIVWRVTWWA